MAKYNTKNILRYIFKQPFNVTFHKYSENQA